MFLCVQSDINFITDLTEERDWNSLSIETKSLLSVHWDTIAICLGLVASKIAEIKKNNSGDCTDCWNSALLEWVRQNYDITEFGEPSWRTFLKAVALADCNKLEVKKLAANHPGMLSISQFEMNSRIGSLCTVKDKLPEPMEASATESSLNESKGELTVVSFSTLVDLRLCLVLRC